MRFLTRSRAMFTKTLIAAAVLAPAIALSAAAHAGGPIYNGGPKSPATYTGPETNKPYAQYLGPQARPIVTPHGYQGGPKTQVPHRRQ